MILSARGLGKRYGGRWILRGLELDLGPGDRLLVTGRNGSGKSTLLRLLSGLVPPSEGTLTLPPEPRRSVAVSALDQALYPLLDAREHLDLAAGLRGCDPRHDLLARADLPGDVPAGRMSTGMRARLRLLLAVQPRPLLLLLDEPGASLDEAGRALVSSVAAEQGTRGALVVATNDPSERRLANLELSLDG